MDVLQADLHHQIGSKSIQIYYFYDLEFGKCFTWQSHFDKLLLDSIS